MKFDLIEGDTDVISVSAFGEYSSNTIRRTRDTLERVGRRLGGRAMEKLKRVKERSEAALDEEVSRIARRIRKGFGTRYVEDIYQYMSTQEQIAAAPPKMINALLASKVIRKRTREQRMESWGIKPTDPRLADLFYEDIERAVYNGVSKEIEVNDQKVWVSDYYYGCNYIDDDKLFIEDQLDILATIAVAEDLIENGIDPTSALGEKLIG